MLQFVSLRTKMNLPLFSATVTRVYVMHFYYSYTTQSILTKECTLHSVAGIDLFILSYLSGLNLESAISCPSLARVMFKILHILLTGLLKPSPDCTIFTEMDSSHAPAPHILPILLLGGLAGTQLLMSNFCEFLRSPV